MERLRKRRKTVSQALSSGRPRLAQGAARARPEGRAEPGSRGTGSRGHPPAPAPLRPGRSRGPRGTGVLQRDVASSPAPAGDQERLLEPRRRPPRRAALRDGPAREREPGAAVCRPSSPSGSRPFTVKGARVRRAGVRPTAGRRGRRRALPPGSTDPVITGHTAARSSGVPSCTSALGALTPCPEAVPPHPPGGEVMCCTPALLLRPQAPAAARTRRQLSAYVSASPPGHGPQAARQTHCARSRPASAAMVS